MTDPELKLRCMELAMEQAKRENLHADRNAVAELQMWFYNRIIECGDAAPAVQPEKADGKRNKSKATDKSAELFRG